MKKTLTTLLALTIAMATPAIASAKTTVQGGPLTNIAAGQTVHIALANTPTAFGLYIQECQQSADTNRPTLCNAAAQLWVSTATGASFAPSADIQFKPTATFTSGSTAVDCTKVTCGIFVRADHTASTDLSEDQFIPITFAASAAASTLPNDVISATVNGNALDSHSPFAVKYRDVFTVNATAQSGATVTYASIAPACAISGNQVTVLKGSGFCDIAITSPGNDKFATVTSHFPLALALGNQKLAKIKALKVNGKVELPAKTNFGEMISYSVNTPKVCIYSSGFLMAMKKGVCTVTAKAPGMADSYKALNQKLTIPVKK